MGFYAYSFLFNDIPSEYYGLKIFNFDNGGKENQNSGGDIEIITQEVYRRPIPYFYGVNQKPVLTFPLIFGSYSALDGITRNVIHKWLFGQINYKKLVIVQDDMIDKYYNCFLINPQTVYIGNLGYAFEATVVCDSPWAWSYDKTFEKTYSSDNVNDSFIFVNESANGDYLYPTVSFTLNSLGSGITITNNTDNGRKFIFTGISPLETITIDNDRQILSSSTGLYRLSKFNLNWFRLLQGMNTINISGGVSSFTMTYKIAKTGG
jgi:phage-related protein